MKSINFYKIIFTILITTPVINTAISDMYKPGQKLWQTLSTVPSNHNFNFEFSNKTGEIIYIELKQEVEKDKMITIIPSSVNTIGISNDIGISNKVQGKFLYPNKNLYLKIWKGNNKGTPHIYVKINPCNKIQCGKTIYLTLDKNGLREQKGTLSGLSGKTESGLSLKNNIKLIGGGPDQNIWNLPVF